MNKSVKKTIQGEQQRILIISQWVPPILHSISSRLGSLLHFFKPGSYVILTDDFEKEYKLKDPNFKLPCKYYFSKFPDLKNRLSMILTIIIIPLMTFKIKSIIKNERIKAILAVNSEKPYIIGAYLLCKIIHTPLYIFLYDLYSEQFTSKFQKTLAKLFEKRIVLKAKKVFVMSPPLANFYKNKYGIETTIIPHPVVQSDYKKNKSNGRERNLMRIVYTGQMGLPWLDSTLNMVDVVESQNDFEFYLYVPRSKEYLNYLRTIGIKGNRVHLGSASREDIVLIQNDADILFMPLSFDRKYRKFFSTASPGKLAEYLAANKPIIVHAPAYSYVAQYAKEYGWGYVVDQLDKELLKNALFTVKNNPGIQQQLLASIQTTIKEHDAQMLASKIREIIQI